MDSGVDNIEVDPKSGDLWVGAHPRIGTLIYFMHREGQGALSPSQVCDTIRQCWISELIVNVLKIACTLSSTISFILLYFVWRLSVHQVNIFTFWKFSSEQLFNPQSVLIQRNLWWRAFRFIKKRRAVYCQVGMINS